MKEVGLEVSMAWRRSNSKIPRDGEEEEEEEGEEEREEGSSNSSSSSSSETVLGGGEVLSVEAFFEAAFLSSSK